MSSLGLIAMALSQLLPLNVRSAQSGKPLTTTPSAHGFVPGPVRFRRIGPDEGLPSLGVYAIAQDAVGFMWFGTRTGLVRYDGKEMKTYVPRPNDASSLSAIDVTALAVDKRGVVWVGTAEGGLNKYVAGSDGFTHFRYKEEDPHSLPSDSVSALFSDSGNGLWVGLGEYGVVKMDPVTGRMVSPSSLGGVMASSFAELPGKQLAIGTIGRGVLVVDARTSNVTATHDRSNGLPSDDVTAVYVDGKGRLWVGTETQGVAMVADGTITRFRHDSKDPSSLSVDKVTVIGGGPADTVWVGTNLGGLNQYFEDGQRFVRHPASPSESDRLSNAWVTSVGMSRDGVAWFGTFGGGINTVDQLKLDFHYYRSWSVPIAAVRESRRDADVVWIGTASGTPEHGGLYSVRRSTGAYTLYRTLTTTAGKTVRLSDLWLTGILEDEREMLWIGTNRAGLLQFDPRTGAAEQHLLMDENTEEPPSIMALAQGKDGGLWLATWGSGLIRFDPATGAYEAFGADPKNPSTIGSDFLYTAVQDAIDENVLWIGTAQGGLNRLSLSDKRVTRYVNVPENPNSLANNNVLCIYQDGTGELWIGTYGGGLNRFSPARSGWTRFEPSARYPSTVYGILADERGRLWLSTNGSGLVVLDRKTNQIASYLGIDGLPGNEFSQGAYHKGRDGRLYFGAPGGFVAFTPDSIRPPSFKPSVVVTDFRILGRSAGMPTRAGIDLSYRDSIISFQFAALGYADPQIRYEHLLEGLHSDWITSEQNRVSYSNLDAGDHVLRVRARTRHGVVSQASAIPIRVAPAPWRTWWAYSLYGLGLAGVVTIYLGYQRQRTRALRQANRLTVVERELELTAAIQSGFLPDSNVIHEDGFGAVGMYIPAEKCGGDWWWYEKLSDDVHLLMVGDVTGHGAGPAMVTASVSTTFRVLRDAWRSSRPDDFLRAANAQVTQAGSGKYLMQLIMAEFHARTGRLVLYSAGGYPALCLRQGTVKIVPMRSAPLGSAGFMFATEELALAPGDRFMLLTDGIPEIELRNGRTLGIRQVSKLYQEAAPLALEEAAESLLQQARMVNHKQVDDWTFVIAEWNPRAAHSAPVARQEYPR